MLFQLDESLMSRQLHLFWSLDKQSASNCMKFMRTSNDEIIISIDLLICCINNYVQCDQNRFKTMEEYISISMQKIYQ